MIEDRLGILTDASDSVKQVRADHILESDEVALTVKPCLCETECTSVSTSSHVIAKCLQGRVDKVNSDLCCSILIIEVIHDAICDCIIVKEDHVSDTLVSVCSTTKGLDHDVKQSVNSRLLVMAGAILILSVICRCSSPGDTCQEVILVDACFFNRADEEIK